MIRRFIPCLIILSALVFGYPQYSFAAGQETMTLDEVEKLIDASPNKEVKAYFRSTPRGIEPVNYEIILRGVLRTPGLNIILFVTSHNIAAGMSGSPTYVGNKLIGAMGYSVGNFSFKEYSWGGISPISSMMEEDKRGSLASDRVGPVSYGGMLFEPIALGYQSVSGLQQLAGHKFIVTKSSSFQNSSQTIKKPVLKSGMPIVVDLVEWIDEDGEITTISAMGTITYIDDGGRIFAFGHPFLDSRKVVYGFRTAEVMGTVISESGSFKLTGKRSEVIGAITFDSTYGIYGSTSSESLKSLHNFNLEFKSEGKSFHNFKIKVADSIMTPILAQSAFDIIGQSNGAPIPQESSVTQIEARVDIENHQPISWQELFASSSSRFGPQTIYTSSYGAAYQGFFNGIYGELFGNRYGLKVNNISISANFISGKNRVFRIGAYKFPTKVVWGESPVLELLLISQDNVLAIAKKEVIKIDWEKIEKPVYTKETLNTEKSSEKVVQGVLGIVSATSFFNNLTAAEKQFFTPEYFLGAEDFLENLARRLELNNQKVFIRFVLKARSGLFDDQVQKSSDIIPQDILDNDRDWKVIGGGIKERRVTVKNDGAVAFYLDLPKIPDGYVVDQRLNETTIFEVVVD